MCIEDQLGLADNSGVQAYFRFEHPVPMLPNIRIARSEIEDAGVGVLTSPFEFGGDAFVPGQSVTTTVDMTHTDVTLYYELVDLAFDLDLGLTARVLDSQLTIDGVTPLMASLKKRTPYYPCSLLPARSAYPSPAFTLQAISMALPSMAPL